MNCFKLYIKLFLRFRFIFKLSWECLSITMATRSHFVVLPATTVFWSLWSERLIFIQLHLLTEENEPNHPWKKCREKGNSVRVFSEFECVWLSFSLCSHQGFSVRVGLLIYDDFGHFVMSAVSGHVQCRQVIVGDIIHGSIVLKEQLYTVQVIPLGRHVQRRQTVL